MTISYRKGSNNGHSRAYWWKRERKFASVMYGYLSGEIDENAAVKRFSKMPDCVEMTLTKVGYESGQLNTTVHNCEILIRFLQTLKKRWPSRKQPLSKNTEKNFSNMEKILSCVSQNWEDGEGSYNGTLQNCAQRISEQHSDEKYHNNKNDASDMHYSSESSLNTSGQLNVTHQGENVNVNEDSAADTHCSSVPSRNMHNNIFQNIPENSPSGHSLSSYSKQGSRSDDHLLKVCEETKSLIAGYTPNNKKELDCMDLNLAKEKEELRKDSPSQESICQDDTVRKIICLMYCSLFEKVTISISNKKTIGSSNSSSGFTYLQTFQRHQPEFIDYILSTYKSVKGNGKEAHIRFQLSDELIIDLQTYQLKVFALAFMQLSLSMFVSQRHDYDQGDINCTVANIYALRTRLKSTLHGNFWLITEEVFTNAVRQTISVRHLHYTVIYPLDSRMNIYIPSLVGGYFHEKDTLTYDYPLYIKQA